MSVLPSITKLRVLIDRVLKYITLIFKSLIDHQYKKGSKEGNNYPVAIILFIYNNIIRKEYVGHLLLIYPIPC